MRCPHCNNDIKGKKCSSCNQTTPAESLFCINCGTELSANNNTESDTEFDINNRILCADGTCIGIVINGKCSECGTPG